MISLILVIGSLIWLAFNGVIEAYTIWAGLPTISRRIQEWARTHKVWVAPICGLVIGLLIHFFG